jgi:DNA-binding HxlR family transcriptional regulator
MPAIFIGNSNFEVTMKAKKKSIILKVEDFCPIRQTIRLLGKQWTLLIVKELYLSRWTRLSFMELSKKLKDASGKVLSERLKEMVTDGLINRKVHPGTKPARVYYSLTLKGKDSFRIIEAFRKYGLKWAHKGVTFDCSRMSCELCSDQKTEGRLSPLAD